MGNVTATDKANQNTKKIVITNDRDRLNKDDIERMVREAEQYAEEDRRNKERVDAKNDLETYTFGLRNTVREHGDKLGDGKDALERNELAETEEFAHQKRELEAAAQPVMAKMHG